MFITVLLQVIFPIFKLILHYYLYLDVGVETPHFKYFTGKLVEVTCVISSCHRHKKRVRNNKEKGKGFKKHVL